jgi:hypothetical protein
VSAISLPEIVEPPSPQKGVWARVRGYLTWRTLLVSMLVIHLAPIWLTTYFPSQDGPAHLYNARIWLDSFDRSNYQIRQFYRAGYELYPNMLTHLMLGGLQKIVPALIAEKLVLSLIIAGVPLSLLYLLNSIERGRGVMCLFGFTFAYHNLLHIGFYNFSLSVSMCLFALGWWWRYRDSMTLAKLGGFYALVLLTYLSHFAGFAVLVLSITIAIGWMSFFRSLFVVARSRRGAFRSDVKTLAIWVIGNFAIMIPLWATAWDYNFRNYNPERTGFNELENLNKIFWKTLTLMSYSQWHRDLSPYVLWTTACVAGLTVLYRLFRLRILQERDALLLICAALVYLFFTLPESRNDGGWVNDRLYILAFVLLWAWFGAFHKWLNVIVGIALIGISVAHTGRLYLDYRQLQPNLRELAAATDLIEPHSTIAWDLDGGFKPDGFPDGTQLVNPWIHALSYYGLKKDVALFENYEAHHSYFMNNWGEAPRKDADYIVSFGRTADQRKSRKNAQYDLLHESANFALFRRKQSPPDASIWTTLPEGTRQARFRMGGSDSDGVRSIKRDRLFQSGSYGWVRTAPRNQWGAIKAEGAISSTLFGDRRDRTFRVDLPDGDYQVTCHFAQNPIGSYQTHVIANDKPVGRVQVADPDIVKDSPQTLTFPVTVTNGQIALVFYSPFKGAPDKRQLRFWGISAIEIATKGK